MVPRGLCEHAVGGGRGTRGVNAAKRSSTLTQATASFPPLFPPPFPLLLPLPLLLLTPLRSRLPVAVGAVDHVQ